MNSDSKLTSASIKNVLELASAALENSETRKILEDIAASEGVGYLKWRDFIGDEALILAKFREKWHMENDFGWPGGMKVITMLNLYFPISIEIIRGAFNGIDDVRIADFINEHSRSLRNS